jgi:excisionase family DNA binding protein
MQNISTNVQQDIPALAVSPAKAARMLGIGRTKLYELIDSRQLRSAKIGNRRLVPVDAIRECLAAHEVGRDV